MLRTTVKGAIINLPQSLPFLLAVGASLLLYFPTWWRLLEQWLRFDQVLAHGLATFALFIGLIIIHPPKAPQPGTGFMSRTRRWPVLAGLSLLAVTGSWLLFELVNIDTLAYLSLPAGVGALVWVFMGFAALWRFIPYLFILGLSLPFWSDLTQPLVDLASWAVGNLVGQFGMTALIEGHSITLPWGRLIIEEGCSGIRYFAISILLAGIISILNDYRWKGWLATLAIAMSLAILINWIRITLLIVIGYQTQMQSSLMQDHELFGWIIFAAVALPVLYFVPVLRRNPAEPPRLTGSIKFKPVTVGFLVAAVIIGPLIATVSGGTLSQQPGWVLANQQPVNSNLHRVPLPLRLPDQLEQTHYHLSDQDVWVNLAQFQRTTTAEKLVPYIGPMLDQNSLQRRRDLDRQNGRFPVQVYRDTMSQRQVAQMQWYRVGEFETHDYRIAKILQIPNALISDNRFALVTLQVRCLSNDCSSQIELLQAVADTLDWVPDS